MRHPDAVAETIASALERVPVNDRLGFLFGLTLGLLRAQGLSDDEIRAEVQRALDIGLGPEGLAST
jgi:hypothetical protein